MRDQDRTPTSVPAGVVLIVIGEGAVVATFAGLMASGRTLSAVAVLAAGLTAAFGAAVRAVQRALAAGDAGATPTPAPDWTEHQLDVLHGQVTLGWPLPPAQERAAADAAAGFDERAGTHFAQLRDRFTADALAELNRLGEALRRAHGTAGWA